MVRSANDLPIIVLQFIFRSIILLQYIVIVKHPICGNPSFETIDESQDPSRWSRAACVAFGQSGGPICFSLRRKAKFKLASQASLTRTHPTSRTRQGCHSAFAPGLLWARDRSTHTRANTGELRLQRRAPAPTNITPRADTQVGSARA